MEARRHLGSDAKQPVKVTILIFFYYQEGMSFIFPGSRSAERAGSGAPYFVSKRTEREGRAASPRGMARELYD